jgi:hypothetical protein
MTISFGIALSKRIYFIQGQILSNFSEIYNSRLCMQMDRILQQEQL